jgi:uncharacterized damage-inducible protein DinB
MSHATLAEFFDDLVMIQRWSFNLCDHSMEENPMRKVSIAVLALCAGALAQDNPLSTSIKIEYGLAKNVITRAADKVPEADYGFKPTEEVRSFGQLVGHVADAQYAFCSAAMGDKNPAPAVEKTKTSKADLVQALKEAFTYCDKAYDGMTDATASQMMKFFGRETPKLGVLAFSNMHDYEHYGNMVTYMRLKHIVPPSSEPRPQEKK